MEVNESYNFNSQALSTWSQNNVTQNAGPSTGPSGPGLIDLDFADDASTDSEATITAEQMEALLKTLDDDPPFEEGTQPIHILGLNSQSSQEQSDEPLMDHDYANQASASQVPTLPRAKPKQKSGRKPKNASTLDHESVLSQGVTGLSLGRPPTAHRNKFKQKRTAKDIYINLPHPFAPMKVSSKTFAVLDILEKVLQKINLERKSSTSRTRYGPSIKKICAIEKAIRTLKENEKYLTINPSSVEWDKRLDLLMDSCIRRKNELIHLQQQSETAIAIMNASQSLNFNQALEFASQAEPLNLASEPPLLGSQVDWPANENQTEPNEKNVTGSVLPPLCEDPQPTYIAETQSQTWENSMEIQPSQPIRSSQKVEKPIKFSSITSKLFTLEPYIKKGLIVPGTHPLEIHFNGSVHQFQILPDGNLQKRAGVFQNPLQFLTFVQGKSFSHVSVEQRKPLQILYGQTPLEQILGIPVYRRYTPRSSKRSRSSKTTEKVTSQPVRDVPLSQDFFAPYEVQETCPMDVLEQNVLENESGVTNGQVSLEESNNQSQRKENASTTNQNFPGVLENVPEPVPVNSQATVNEISPNPVPGFFSAGNVPVLSQTSTAEVNRNTQGLQSTTVPGPSAASVPGTLHFSREEFILPQNYQNNSQVGNQLTGNVPVKIPVGNITQQSSFQNSAVPGNVPGHALQLSQSQTRQPPINRKFPTNSQSANSMTSVPGFVPVTYQSNSQVGNQLPGTIIASNNVPGGNISQQPSFQNSTGNVPGVSVPANPVPGHVTYLNQLQTQRTPLDFNFPTNSQSANLTTCVPAHYVPGPSQPAPQIHLSHSGPNLAQKLGKRGRPPGSKTTAAPSNLPEPQIPVAQYRTLIVEPRFPSSQVLEPGVPFYENRKTDRIRLVPADEIEIKEVLIHSEDEFLKICSCIEHCWNIQDFDWN